jgi:hypothetical protein
MVVIGIVKSVLRPEKQAGDNKKNAQHGKNQFYFHNQFPFVNFVLQVPESFTISFTCHCAMDGQRDAMAAGRLVP